MAPEPATLVRLVMEILGVKGATALARELGMSDYSAPRKIADWLEGKYAPNYEATMLMLERVGFLNLDASKSRTAVEAWPLSDRAWYLLEAADDGRDPESLALIFNVSEDEAKAELQRARDELAKWEEIRGQPLVVTTPSTPEESERIRKELASYNEAFARVGETTLESLASQVRGLRARLDTSESELRMRLKNLEQEMRKHRSKAE